MWLWGSFVYIKVVGDLLQIHIGKCVSSGKNIYLFRLQWNVTGMILVMCSSAFRIWPFQNGHHGHGNHESFVFFNGPIVMKLHRNDHWNVQMCIQAGFVWETFIWNLRIFRLWYVFLLQFITMLNVQFVEI